MTWGERQKSQLKKLRRENEVLLMMSGNLIGAKIKLEKDLDIIKKSWYYRLYQFFKRLFRIRKNSGRGNEKIEKKEDQQKRPA